MIGQEDKKISVSTFNGIYDRGVVDEVPPDHAQDVLNMKFTTLSHVTTREGFSKSMALPVSGMRRFFLMSALAPNFLEPISFDPGATDGRNLLWLDNSHNLRIGNDGTPTYTNSAMDDFCALNVGNRTYISPNSGGVGVRGAVLQVLNPLTGATRDAAGLAPVQFPGSAMAAANSGTGNVPAGVHKIAVIYETDTGFWTPPGPKDILSCSPTASPTDADPTVFTCTNHRMLTGESHLIGGGTNPNWGGINGVWYITRIDDDHFSIPLDSHGWGAATGSIFVYGPFTPATVTVDGASSISVSVIPTGPSFVKKRLILATRADENEFFFVPNVPGSLSEINDNTTTSTVINFDDTDLVDSADYLFDVMEQIPGGSSMTKYRGRVVLAGCYIPGNDERVFLSNVNDPETFDFVSGYVQVQTERDGNGVRNCFVLRDTLYISKFTGTFATEDNGNAPSSWAVTIIDGVVGSYNYGASSFTVSQPTPDTGDIVLIASKSGLYSFDGVIRRPELSYKIQSLWLRINFSAFFRVTVAHDPWNHLVYISCPLDTATEPDTLLVMDYTNGRDYQNVRWSKYKLHRNPTCIGMAYFGSNISPTAYNLKVGSIDADSAHLWYLNPVGTNDDANTIVSTLTPGPFGFGGIGIFKLLTFRAWGKGLLKIQISGEDGASLMTLPSPPVLSAAPRKEIHRQINLMNEKLTVKLTNGISLDDRMQLDRMDVWGLSQWPIRPAV